MSSVQILTFPSGPLATNAYLIICKKSQECAIVDPAPEIGRPFIQLIEQKKLIPTKIILTHSHWDHIADVKIIASHFSLPVLVHKEDAYNLISPGSDGIGMRLHIEPTLPDQLLSDGDIIAVGKTIWQVIHTPGHSPGSICLFCPEEKILLSGDTLFKNSIGNLSFSSSCKERMWPSLKKLSLLPSETIVYPGHGPTTTIGKESFLDHAEEVFG